jgi:hypothetical protein
MNTKYSLNNHILTFAVALLVGLNFQSVNAGYNMTDLTPDEVRKLNKETIAREQAQRVREKKMFIMQERKKQLKHAQQRRLYTQRGQQHMPRSQRVKSHGVPAWRKSAGNTMAHNDDALLHAAKTKNLHLLKQLVSEGANIHHKNFDGESSLHIAASLGNIQMVQYLLSQRANVNDRTTKNWLPIHHAIRFNHPVVANYLIANRASIWLKNSDGFTALDFAARSRNTHLNAIARRHGR